jgi:hypothetical protein
MVRASSCVCSFAPLWGRVIVPRLGVDVGSAGPERLLCPVAQQDADHRDQQTVDRDFEV